jgi:hypothetical protein
MSEEKVVRRTIKPIVEESTEIKTINPIDQSEEKFLEFVKQQMETMNNSLLFNYKEPTMYELNMSLSQWESVWFGLVTIYGEARWASQKAKEEYDEWWACKFMDVRNRENKTSMKRTMWLSTTEIENTVISENLAKVRELKAAMLESEAKRELMGRIMDGWTNYQWILNRLSTNSVAEIQGNVKGNVKVDLDPELNER